MLLLPLNLWSLATYRRAVRESRFARARRRRARCAATHASPAAHLRFTPPPRRSPGRGPEQAEKDIAIVLRKLQVWRKQLNGRLRLIRGHYAITTPRRRGVLERKVEQTSRAVDRLKKDPPEKLPDDSAKEGCQTKAVDKCKKDLEKAKSENQASSAAHFSGCSPATHRQVPEITGRGGEDARPIKKSRWLSWQPRGEGGKSPRRSAERKEAPAPAPAPAPALLWMTASADGARRA